MINKEKKLTVDDLIVVYLAEKTKQGYIPEVTETEFMDFLNYFTKWKEVDDLLPDYHAIIQRFFERKNKKDWYYQPHMDFTEDGILKPNYKFSMYDESVINSYFMANEEKQAIYKHITGYLKSQPKRVLNIETLEDSKISEDCKLCSALYMHAIWKEYIESKIENRQWPRQCKDIFKYLIEDDLAKRINLGSQQEKYFKFYDLFTKSTNKLLKEDPNLRIEKSKGRFLAHANYQLATETCNLPYKSILSIDYPAQQIKIKIDYYQQTYYWGNEHFPLQSKFVESREHAKKLVKAIEKVRN